MSYNISILKRNVMLDAVSSTLDSGYIRIYSGSRPVSPETAPSGTLLAELTFGSPAFAAASAGTLTANSITQDSSADNNGTAGWFRLYESDGTTPVMDGTVTALGGGGELEMSTTSIIAGYPVQIVSLTISIPS